MIHTWKLTIPELTGDEERTAYIYLPESYSYQADKQFPVLYMFDGHNVFFDSHATYGKCWGMKEYMDYTNTQLIIVAVECNHSPDNGRLREYSPYNFNAPGIGRITGLGKLTMDWIVNSLKPYIDEHYRTIPDRDHTFIAGSSMGGLMSLYALMAYNDVFSGAAALSPSLWTNPNLISSLINKSKIRPNTILYMDYGSEELADNRNAWKEYDQICSRLLHRHIALTSRIVPGGTHCEASWERQIPSFMQTILYNVH